MLRVAAGVGVLVVLLSATSLALSGAGNAGESAPLLALGIPALVWAAWRPSWLAGLAAAGAGALPLTFVPLGIVMVPVIGGATLVLIWQRTSASSKRRPGPS